MSLISMRIVYGKLLFLDVVRMCLYITELGSRWLWGTWGQTV